MDHVGLGRPIIEIPGLLGTLRDLDERGFHIIGIFRTLDSERIPTVLVKTNLLSVGQNRSIRCLSEINDLTVGRLDSQFASESSRNVHSVIMVAGLPVQ